MTEMLSRVAVRDRLQSEEGLSLAEFTYQSFQAYDWLYLFDKYNCSFQVIAFYMLSCHCRVRQTSGA